MRNRPAPVDAVAVEAAAQLVEQAAFGHARQRQRRHVQRLQVRRVLRRARVPVPQCALQQRGVREFRRRTEAAPLGIEAALELHAAVAQRCGIERLRTHGRGRLQLAQRMHHCASRGTQIRFVIAVVVGHVVEQRTEGRHAVARHRRKVRAAEERALVVMHQEHRQRPAAAASREHLVRQLVETVEVRSFLAVHLDVDEARVHQRRGCFVLERLVRHDMAPVAGRIADRQQDRPALTARERQRCLAPGVPVDRIGGVLAQVGAGFRGEAVAVGVLVHCR
jgi:hypothetical protein